MSIVPVVGFIVCMTCYVLVMRTKPRSRSRRRIMTAVAVAVVMVCLGALVGCAPPEENASPAVVGVSVYQWGNPNIACTAEIAFGTAALVFVTVTAPPVGAAAWFFYGGSAFYVGWDIAQCQEAADAVMPSFDVQLSCDGGVHVYTESFTRVYDLATYIQSTRCFTEGGGGGGGGGSVGGW